MPEDLNIVITEDRVKDMDLELFYNIESKSPKTTVEFIAHFVQIDGAYPAKEDAIRQVLNGRKVKDLEGIMEQVVEAIEDMAVPKE